MAKSGNFWGDDKKTSNETKTLPKTQKPRQKSKPDFRWLILCFGVIIALVAGIIINTNHANETATKFANAIDVDNDDLKINWDRYQTTDIQLSESLTITKSGTYHLTGTLESGLVIVDAGISEVRLVLDNATINNPTGPAIACYSAEDLVIELVGENHLSDGDTYSTEYDEDVTGLIYSKADLTFQGDGSLNIVSNYQDGIVSKDDLKFNGGTYDITSTDDAIRGKDSVYIVAGDLTINSAADAIKTTNDIDTGKGFILIEDGNLNVASSAKGLKSVKNILIYGGHLTLDTYDDAIHSDNYVGIIGGQINISSGDDGIHANQELIIDGGNIAIAKAYEGIEAKVLTINGGDISLITSDDGINAGSSGEQGTTTNNRRNATPDNADETCIVSINGGNLYINAAGDGIDSNGWVYINGGTVIVDGPTDNGNGALDAGSGIVMNGGEAIAVGASGMAESLGSTSSIYNASIYLSAIQPADTKITIKNSSGDNIIEHTSAKSFSHIAAGSPRFNFGETYILYLNDEIYEQFTISETVTTVGSGSNNFNHTFRR